MRRAGQGALRVGGESEAQDRGASMTARAIGSGEMWRVRWMKMVALLLAGAATTLYAGVGTATAFDSTPSGFGFHSFEASLSDTQAGSHPNLNVTLEFNNEPNSNEEPTLVGGEARDLSVNLPPGLAGNPTAVPQCTRQELDAEKCPADSQVGVDTIGLGPVTKGLFLLQDSPVYNMVPPSSKPAEFDFDILGIETFIDSGVRSGTDDGITSHIDNIAQRGVIYNSITIFGEVEGRPFLTAPTSCGAPLQFSAQVSTWEDPSASAQASFTGPVVTGCQRLVHFDPSLTAAPDTAFADTPAGLTTEVQVPQGENPEGLATSSLQDTTVTLPEGVAINPGQAAGLEACQPEQDGLGGETDGESKEGPPECPSASKVGTVEIETPLLKDTLKGNVYVLQSNPPELKLLVAASADGVNLKLVGTVHLNTQTGRLTTTFEGTPELPFTVFRLSFSGGAQAALSTPTGCGTYETTSDFTPWASPFVPDAFPTSSFQITAGSGGSACPSSPLPFSPSMIAGSTTDQAGGYTNFSLLLQRDDGQQRIERLQFKVPEGLSGMLSTVPLCPEPQAQEGKCPESSKIGHAAVASGPGPYPLVIPQPGNPESGIYLTGPYGGAPFGLTIETHVIAGPFDLESDTSCDCIVTRARIEVDPHTAQITVTTEPLPQIIDGVPTDLRLIDSVIDRPGFMFNPTNCNSMSFSGTAWGTPPPGVGGPGASAPIESHFQVGSCRSLEFKPSFAVSTSGKTSRADGASLSVKLIYPNAPQGTQTNIAKVKVELPEQLPSRLSTLQKACVAATFEANSANCPAASVVGHAKAITPLLPVPLEGPAYFVSYGGEAFPSLIIVLQGDNVTLDLVGTTFISKAGVTSSTFKTVPDAPVGSFELTLPEGPYSALGTQSNLCKSKLTMPTEFVAQNGAEIHESTKIAVTGCPKAMKAGKHKRHGKHRKRTRGKGKRK
jgi:hypothetical protein